MTTNQTNAILRAIYDIPSEYIFFLSCPEFENNLFSDIKKNINNKLDIPDIFDYLMYSGPKDYIILNQEFLRGLTSKVIKAANYRRLDDEIFRENNPEEIDEYGRIVYVNPVPSSLRNAYYDNPQRWHKAFAKVNRGKISIESYISPDNMFKYCCYKWLILFPMLSRLHYEGKVDLINIANKLQNISFPENTNQNVLAKYEEFKINFARKIELLSKFKMIIEESYFSSIFDNNKIGGNFFLPELDIKRNIMFTMMYYYPYLLSTIVLSTGIVMYKVMKK